MHWKVLPHLAYSPDLVPRDFQLFDPFKEALRGKRFRDDDEVKLSVQPWLSEEQQILFASGIMKVPERWRRCKEVREEYSEKYALRFEESVIHKL